MLKNVPAYILFGNSIFPRLRFQSRPVRCDSVATVFIRVGQIRVKRTLPAIGGLSFHTDRSHADQKCQGSFSAYTVSRQLIEQLNGTLSNFGSSAVAATQFDSWAIRAMSSGLEPTKAIVRILQTHCMLILDLFRSKKEFCSGTLKALNGNLKLVTRRCERLRAYEVA